MPTQIDRILKQQEWAKLKNRMDSILKKHKDFESRARICRLARFKDDPSFN